MAADSDDAFDPRGLLQVLERHRVAYVVIGALARVLHGTDEVTGGVDVCPQRRAENLERLDAALAELGAAPVATLIAPERADPQPAADAVIRRETEAGVVQVVAVPEGTRGGWNDLRLHANRASLGDGLRVPVASLDDLVRMSAALDREQDVAVRGQLRRLVELERGRDVGLDL